LNDSGADSLGKRWIKSHRTPQKEEKPTHQHHSIDLQFLLTAEKCVKVCNTICAGFQIFSQKVEISFWIRMIDQFNQRNRTHFSDLNVFDSEKHIKKRLTSSTTDLAESEETFPNATKFVRNEGTCWGVAIRQEDQNLMPFFNH
jgi:hypothetical protein